MPLSSKVMLDRDDYETLATAAEEFVVQEKKECKLRTLLNRAEKRIEELQAKIGELLDTVCSLRGELEKYKDNSIMDRLSRGKRRSPRATCGCAGQAAMQKCQSSFMIINQIEAGSVQKSS